MCVGIISKTSFTPGTISILGGGGLIYYSLILLKKFKT